MVNDIRLALEGAETDLQAPSDGAVVIAAEGIVEGEKGEGGRETA